MVETQFPTLIYLEQLSYIYAHEAFKKRMYEVKHETKGTDQWECDTYGSFNTYDLRQDPTFKNLIDTVTEHVTIFSHSFGIDTYKAECNGSWFNIAEPGNFQEFHMHANSHFSAVYYVNSPPKCGNIVFKSHEADTQMFLAPYERSLPENWTTMFYPAVEGRLIIFRSNLQHMVQKNLSTGDRISIAMNFVMEKK
jgi:uncharacterized protein (TIGR02466 family)